MRLHEMPSPILALISGLCIMRPVAASVIPNFLQSYEDLQDVRKRCDTPCGYYGQLCCQSGETCYTDGNNQAQCGPAVIQTQAAAGSGDWLYSTTTYLLTDLRTVTTTISWQETRTTQAACNQCNSCQYSLGETPCGNTCCRSGHYCQTSGMCVAVDGGSSGFYSSIITEVVTGTVTAPSRPTMDTLVTVTATDGSIITTTQAFVAPSGTGGAIITGPQPGSGGGGLSGGAIAGIVIGVIAAIIILLLICACCCFKGLIDGLLGIFGLGQRKRRRTEETEVYESRHHHSGRTGGRTWFGTKPGRKTSVDEKKAGGGWGRIAGVSAFLGGMALLLGMKRKKDKKDDKSSSGYGSSYYSDYTSSSESSSDRRSRRNSRSRSRASRTSRAVSRTSRR